VASFTLDSRDARAAYLPHLVRVELRPAVGSGGGHVVLRLRLFKIKSAINKPAFLAGTKKSLNKMFIYRLCAKTLK